MGETSSPFLCSRPLNVDAGGSLRLSGRGRGGEGCGYLFLPLPFPFPPPFFDILTETVALARFAPSEMV